MLKKVKRGIAKARWVAAEVRAKVGERRVAQAGRFLRVGALAGLAIWLDGGHQLTASAGWAALAGAGEVIYRQVKQTVAVGAAAPDVPSVAVEDLPAQEPVAL